MYSSSNTTKCFVILLALSGIGLSGLSNGTAQAQGFSPFKADCRDCPVEQARSPITTVLSYLFDPNGGDRSQNDIVETAKRAGSFNLLLAALEAGDLTRALKGPGPFTVFAPTDDAFNSLPSGVLQDLLKPENKSALQDVLTFHVVGGEAPASRVVQARTMETLNGASLPVTIRGSSVFVSNANIIAVDIPASNGIIHVIDAVMIPPGKDASTGNGLDLVDRAVREGSFNTLVSLVQAAGLEDVLRRGGPFTLFAPTDDALAKLPQDLVRDLLEPRNVEKLQAILAFHVVPGAFDSSQVLRRSSFPTVNGSPLDITLRGGSVYANATSKVVATDIEASNGIIHAVDTVMIPQ